MNSITIQSEPEIDVQIPSAQPSSEAKPADVEEFQKAMIFQHALKSAFLHRPVPMPSPFRESALLSANNSGRISEELAELMEGAPSESVALAAAAANLRPQSAPVFARMAFDSNPGQSSEIAEAVVARAVPESRFEGSDIAQGVARELIQANPKEAVQIAMSVFVGAVSANPELAKDLAPALIKVVEELAPQSALDAAKALVGLGFSLNPAQVPEITQGVLQVLIPRFPAQAGEIAASIISVAVLPEAALPSRALGETPNPAPGDLPALALVVFDSLMTLLPNIQPPKTAEFAAQIIDAVAKSNPDMAVQITSDLVSRALPLLGENAADFPVQVLEKLRESSPVIAEAVAGVLIGLSGNAPSPPLSEAPAKTDGVVVSPEKPTKDQSSPDAPVFQPPVAQPAVQNLAPGTPMPQVESRPTGGADIQSLLKLIAETVSKLEIGETSTTIELKNAPGLAGDVKLSLKLENGSLEVTIEASDENTRALLEINSTALKEALAKTASAGAIEISFKGHAENASAESGTDHESSRDGDSQSSDSGRGEDSQTRVSGKGARSGAQK